MLSRRSSGRAIGSTDRQRLAARPWNCSRYLRLCHQRHCADRGSNAFRRLVRGAGLVCGAGREFARLPGNDSDGGIPEVVLRSLSRHTTDEDENAGRVDEIREDCNEAWKQAMQVRPRRALSVHHYLPLGHILIGLQFYRQGARTTFGVRFFGRVFRKACKVSVEHLSSGWYWLIARSSSVQVPIHWRCGMSGAMPFPHRRARGPKHAMMVWVAVSLQLC